MLKIIVLVIVILLAIILVYAATRPDELHVERTISIKAPPEKIFALINDFRQWDGWTPYNKDPAMKKTYSGSASGKGAVYAWEGNSEVGQGRDIHHRRHAVVADRVRPAHDQAVRGAQRRRVHAEGERRFHRGHVGHGRQAEPDREGHGTVLRHGQDGRQGLRDRAGQAEGDRREVIARIAGTSARKEKYHAKDHSVLMVRQRGARGGRVLRLRFQGREDSRQHHAGEHAFRHGGDRYHRACSDRSSS